MNTGGESSYTVQQWENAIGARVRATMASPEIERYFNIRMTPARARIALLQLSLFIQCRRDCWANLIANCDALPIRQRLMEHEYDELVEDEYSSTGHYDLLVRQGALIGLTAADFGKVEPLRTSMATFYGWKWIAREGSWKDGLIAMMATEWVNDDRRLLDQGGGLSRRGWFKMDQGLWLYMGGDVQLCRARRCRRETQRSVCLLVAEIYFESAARPQSRR